MATKTSAKILLARRRKLLEKLSSHGDYIRGSINAVCSACKRCNCSCEGGASKKYHRLTYKDENQRTRTVYIAKDQLARTRRLLANHQKFKETLKQLSDVNVDIYKLGE